MLVKNFKTQTIAINKRQVYLSINMSPFAWQSKSKAVSKFSSKTGLE